jgi:protein Mpv17
MQMKLVAILLVFVPLVDGFIINFGRGVVPCTSTTKTSPNTIETRWTNYEEQPKVSSITCTVLHLSDVPLEEQEDETQSDPINSLVTRLKSINIDAFINISILLIVSTSVLNHVATVDAGIMRGWTTEEMAIRIPIDNWLSYSDVLDKSPLMTKAVTSATVYTIGDMIAQGTEGRGVGEIDRLRVIRSLIAGLIGHGPMSHVWYDVSENLFENVMHLQQGVFGTAAKVAIDQSIWGPLWNNTYILLLGLMKFDKLETIVQEMKSTTIPLIVSGLKLWPLAHCVTYGLVPVEDRLLWVDMVEIIWVTILASTAAGGAHGDTEIVQHEEE